MATTIHVTFANNAAHLFDGAGPHCRDCGAQKLRPHPNPARGDREVVCMGCGRSSEQGYAFVEACRVGAERLAANFRAMNPPLYETRKPKEQTTT